MLRWLRNLRGWTKLWLGWLILSLGLFFAIEMPAVFNDEAGDTLTEHVVNYIPPELYWVGAGAFGAWFCFHIARRQIARYRREESDDNQS